MRAPSAAGIFAGVLLFTGGCGGKVVVDAEPDGAGGSMSASAASGGGDAGSGFTCSLLCGGPVGVCGCAGTCSDGKMRAVGCGATATGATCTCSVDEQVVGSCDEASLLCGLPASCCQALFGG
ncbi:MAG: hypothetical protein ABI193_19145 [Minicystis sp.]